MWAGGQSPAVIGLRSVVKEWMTGTVNVVPPPVIDSFTAAPATITAGGSSRLTWAVTGATSLSIDQNIGIVTGSTSATVSPNVTTTYTLTATNATDSAVTAQTTVTIRQDGPPTASFTVSCDHLECTFTSTSTDDVGITGYSWSGSGVSGTTSAITHTFASAGSKTVTLTVRDAENQTDTADETFDVESEPPVASFQFDCTYLSCAFWSTSTDDLAVTGHTWSGSGVSGTRGTTGHNFTNPGLKTVTLTVRDAENQTDTADETFDVESEPPVASFQFDCTYLSCAFWSTSTDDLAVTGHTWSGSGVSGTRGTTGHNFTNPGLKTVTLTVRDAENQTATATERFVVQSMPPEADFTASCDHLDCTFTSTSTDDLGVTGYQWSGSGVSGTASQVRHTFRSAGEKTVRLTVWDGDDPPNSDAADTTVYVGTRPPQASFTVECDYLDCTFTSTSTDDLGITRYQWSGAGVSGTASEVEHNFTSAGRKTVTLTVWDGDPQPNSHAATNSFTVEPRPPVVDSFYARPQTIAAGDASTLSWRIRDATSARIEPGVGPVSRTGGNRNVYPDQTTTYSLIATNAAGTADTATVTVVCSLEVGITANRTLITRGESVELSWTSGCTTRRSIAPSVGTVTESGSRSVTPSRTTTYTLTGWNAANATATDTVRVRVVGPPEVTITADRNSIIVGDTVTLEWTATNTDSVRITPGVGKRTGTRGTEEVTPGVGQTTYTITGWNGASGTHTDTVTVTVQRPPPPIINSFTANASTIYRGESSTLSWDIDDATSASIDMDIGSVSHTTGSQDVTPSMTTTYTLTANGPGGEATASRTVLVNHNDTPVANFYASCGNHRCWFNASRSTNNIGTTSYSWDYGDGNGGSGERVTHTYDSSYDSVTVTLTVSDQYGLSDSESMTVVVSGDPEERSSANNPPPTADFTTDCNDLACTFTSTSTDDTGIESYLWSTGDGAAAGTKSVLKHTYGSAGRYTVTLVVRDGHGGFGAALYQIQVEDP